MKNYVEFFTDSLARVTGDEAGEQDFFALFYDNFMASSPEVAERFKQTDMARQREMLHRSLEEMVAFSASRSATEQMRRVARLHSRDHLDIPPSLYDLRLESLVQTLHEADPECTEEVELAWRVVLAPGVAYMKFKYDHF